MRSFIIITVLSALAACYGAAVLPSEKPEGYITMVFDEESPNGRVVSEAELNNWMAPNGWYYELSTWKCDAPPIYGEVQHFSVRYEGHPDVVIKSYSISYYPPAPMIHYSPIGTNFMEVNITTLMRSFIIITVLSALAASYGTADVWSEKEMQERYNIMYNEESTNGKMVSDAALNEIISKNLTIIAQ
uniref:SFRICE_015436 n=1 Tax=Spodoptera frugiperda TaxID=7108 RepID=A0A2H1VVP0_SPOFR